MSVVDLNEVASQTGFAKLLGVSQQAVSKQVQKGTLSEDGTYGQWLHEYYQHLSDQAAGRGGDNQVDVAQATIEEKQVKTALARLDYNEKLGNLINKEEALVFLSEWAGYANRQIRQAFDRFKDDVESQLDVSVPIEMGEKHAGAAIERVRGFALKLGGDSGESGEDSETAKEAEH